MLYEVITPAPAAAPAAPVAAAPAAVVSAAPGSIVAYNLNVEGKTYRLQVETL